MFSFKTIFQVELIQFPHFKTNLNIKGSIKSKISKQQQSHLKQKLINNMVVTSDYTKLANPNGKTIKLANQGSSNNPVLSNLNIQTQNSLINNPSAQQQQPQQQTPFIIKFNDQQLILTSSPNNEADNENASSNNSSYFSFMNNLPDNVGQSPSYLVIKSNESLKPINLNFHSIEDDEMNF